MWRIINGKIQTASVEVHNANIFHCVGLTLLNHNFF